MVLQSPGQSASLPALGCRGPDRRYHELRVQRRVDAGDNIEQSKVGTNQTVTVGTNQTVTNRFVPFSPLGPVFSHRTVTKSRREPPPDRSQQHKSATSINEQSGAKCVCHTQGSHNAIVKETPPAIAKAPTTVNALLQRYDEGESSFANTDSRDEPVARKSEGSGNEDDFSRCLARLDQFVRLASLGERHFFLRQFHDTIFHPQ